MKLLGLAMLSALAFAPQTASAMPAGPAGLAPGVENVRLVCDAYGRCFNQPGYYAPPRVYGDDWRRRREWRDRRRFDYSPRRGDGDRRRDGDRRW